jgi:cytochrome c553
MLDLAAHYSYLPRQPGTHLDPTVDAPHVVARGAPMRNIPTQNSVKLGAPWLDGQSAVYIKAQLQAFSSGTRRNEISQQMLQYRPPDDSRRNERRRTLLRGAAVI